MLTGQSFPKPVSIVRPDSVFIPFPGWAAIVLPPNNRIITADKNEFQIHQVVKRNYKIRLAGWELQIPLSESNSGSLLLRKKSKILYQLMTGQNK